MTFICLLPIVICGRYLLKLTNCPKTSSCCLCIQSVVATSIIWGIKYRMLPMSNIGMSISTWRNVTRNIGNYSQPVKDMVDFLTEEFGNVTQQSIVKGKNDEWYMDQKIISILVQKWINSNVERRKKVLYLPRNTVQDRIDRNRWPREVEISKKVDAHLPNNAFMTKKWRETKPLLKLLTLNDTELYAWCIIYHKKFSETLVEVRNARGFIGRQLSSGHSWTSKPAKSVERLEPNFWCRYWCTIWEINVSHSKMTRHFWHWHFIHLFIYFTKWTQMT